MNRKIFGKFGARAVRPNAPIRRKNGSFTLTALRASPAGVPFPRLLKVAWWGCAVLPARRLEVPGEICEGGGTVVAVRLWWSGGDVVAYSRVGG